RLYEKHGFNFFFAEDEMHRDLNQPIPAVRLPEGMEFAEWSPTAAFTAYEDAFRERPGFPGWTEAVWRQNFTGFDSFRPGLSLVVMNEHNPTAYAVCAVENGQGWIIQIGVRPVYRQQGVGGAVLAETMRRFKAVGLETAMLEVNVNNPQAAHLYKTYGFLLAKRTTIYHKILR
ncbi:MAG: GNAT family N-acetyltransferase, partial [Anaerolineae bacterium]|nr:GNAT family N-acetyltransferase [Anaerolineae bacterium]